MSDLQLQLSLIMVLQKNDLSRISTTETILTIFIEKSLKETRFKSGMLF